FVSSCLRGGLKSFLHQSVTGLGVPRPCMVNKHTNRSTARRRVHAVTSAARNRVDATTGPRPTRPQPSAAVPQQGPTRPRVLSSEQPTEPLETPRSHSQDRIPAMPSQVAPQTADKTIPSF